MPSLNYRGRYSTKISVKNFSLIVLFLYFYKNLGFSLREHVNEAHGLHLIKKDKKAN
jgi:hypothetical protein